MLIVLACVVLFISACERESKNATTTAPSPPTETTPPAPPPPPPIEPRIIRELTSAFNKCRQSIFDAIHPIGTAKLVKIHDVEIDWKRGEKTNLEEDIKTIGIRYTVFWEGPITKDGFTKMSSTYDAEVGRYTGNRILATNGITNEDVGEGLGFAIGVAIGASMSEE